MATQNSTEQHRVLDEMMEMAQALQGHHLISKHDMAKMTLLCERYPEYTSGLNTPRQLKPLPAQSSS